MKVKILNRGDCCEKRLNGTKIFVGDELIGILDDPAQRLEITVGIRLMDCRSRS